MAQLSNVRFRALSATNTIVSGAGLFIYEEGSTSSLVTIYSDSALTTPTSNPLTSNSSGYFPQFYIAAGQVVDIYMRQTTSTGSTLLWQALSVDTVGNEAEDTFYRNFAANGRVQIVGSGGLVRLEFGDPTGDNTGGDAECTGWNGTDLTSYTHRGPLSVTGAVTSQSASSDYKRKLTSGTCSASASQVIALDSAYDCYEIIIQDFSASAGGNVNAVFSFDNGSTYKTASGDYDGDSKGIGGTTISDYNNDASMLLGPTAAFIAGEFRLIVHSEVGKETVMGGNGMTTPATTYSSSVYMISATTKAKNYGKATNIKITTSSGTLTFKYAVFGVPGF